MTKDPRIDQYIEKQAPFAKEILIYIREMVHALPIPIEETLKWGMPHFVYKGNICGMAAFKEHCAFTLHKASLLEDKAGVLKEVGESGMGHFGKLRSIADLPDKVLIQEYLMQAARLNEQGIKIPRKKISPQAIQVPEDLAQALEGNSKAQATFDGFPPSQKKEYIEWLNDAKRESTRQKRLQTTIEWLGEGKRRNWRYE